MIDDEAANELRRRHYLYEHVQQDETYDEIMDKIYSLEHLKNHRESQKQQQEADNFFRMQ